MHATVSFSLACISPSNTSLENTPFKCQKKVLKKIKSLKLAQNFNFNVLCFYGSVAPDRLPKR